MAILGCLDVSTSGDYHLDGVDVGDLNDNQLADIRSHKIGFVFQQFNLLARTSRPGQRDAAADLRRHAWAGAAGKGHGGAAQGGAGRPDETPPQ